MKDKKFNGKKDLCYTFFIEDAYGRKNYDLETASSYVVSGSSNIESPYTDENTSEQNLFTETLTKYVTNCAKEMTYVLGETTLDGDTAIIPVTFTYVDASPVISETLKYRERQAAVLWAFLL